MFPLLHPRSTHEPAAGGEQGDTCVPQVHAGGEPSTACHRGISEQWPRCRYPLANGRDNGCAHVPRWAVSP